MVRHTGHVDVLILSAHVCREFESWGLSEPPDYVTFAKKTTTAGFYHKDSKGYMVS